MALVGLVTAVGVDRIGAVMHARTPSCAETPDRCGASGSVNAGKLSANVRPPSSSQGPEIDNAALDRHLAGIEAQVQLAREEFLAADRAYVDAQANPKTLPQELTRLEGLQHTARMRLAAFEHQKAEVVHMKSATASAAPVPVIVR